MFRKTITFENFLGATVTQDFYFHISKVELMDLQLDNLQEKLAKMLAEQNPVDMFRQLKDLILLAVGRRSEDGNSFVKTEQIRQEFANSPAFDELLMELAQNPNNIQEFFVQIMPSKMRGELEQAAKKATETTVSDPFAEKEDNRPAWEKEHRDPRPDEVKTMTPEQLQAAFRKKLGITSE